MKTLQFFLAIFIASLGDIVLGLPGRIEEALQPRDTITQISKPKDISTAVRTLVVLQNLLDYWQKHARDEDALRTLESISTSYSVACTQFCTYLQNSPPFYSKEDAIHYTILHTIRFEGIQEALRDKFHSDLQPTTRKVIEFASEYFPEKMNLRYQTDQRLLKKIEKYESAPCQLFTRLISCDDIKPSFKDSNVQNLYGENANKEYEIHKDLSDKDEIAHVYNYNPKRAEFVMKKYDGSLDAVNNLSVEELVMISHELEQALTTLHRSGYIHCDIKPANIFYNWSFATDLEGRSTRRLKVYLGDLGFTTDI